MDSKERIQAQGSLEGTAILVGRPFHAQAMRQLEAARQAAQAAREAVDKLIEDVAAWEFEDPLTQIYSELFTANVVAEMQMERKRFEAAAEARFKLEIPPGFRDKGKGNGGSGDLEIWFTMMEVCERKGADGILISEDRKDDWFHQSGKGGLFPRYELHEEFRERTGAKAFSIERLSWLLRREGASEVAISEVRSQERSDLPYVAGRTPVVAQAFSILGQRLARVSKFMGAEVHTGEDGVDFVADLRGYRVGLAMRELSTPHVGSGNSAALIPETLLPVESSS